MPTVPPHGLFHQQCLELLARTGTILQASEAAHLELADMGLGRFDVEGIGVIVYINNDRYCAKELLMLPGQTCPQHRHPPVKIGNITDPGKMETFRCRWGKVFLYVDGAPTNPWACKPPPGKEAYYTASRQIELNPGDQFTISPDTWHWFQAGEQGAVVSEFSSTSRDEFDIFTDPGVKRVGAGNRG